MVTPVSHRILGYISLHMLVFSSGSSDFSHSSDENSLHESAGLPLGVRNWTASDMGPIPLELRAWILK